MIIKKKKQSTKKNIEKTFPLEVSSESVVEIESIKTEEVEEQIQNEEFENSNSEFVDDVPYQPQPEPEPEIDLFDIGNIDFNQRQERRRGSRRRGYRRIEDRNLVSRAQEEAENIKRSAFEEGYQKGIEKSAVDIEQFKKEFVKFMNAKKDVFEYIAPDILEISVDIAKKIIKKEVDADPQVLINTIVDVLKNVSKNEPKVTIRVKPQAVTFIKDVIPNISYEYGIDAKINVLADPSIEDGGCIFQTNNGIVDASIDTQLEIIKKTLESI